MTGADAFPLDRVRADTPGVGHVAHFNNAGAALTPSVVVETVVDHLREEHLRGGYEAAGAASERREAVYRSIARLVGADPTQIALVEHATAAWNAAVYGFPFEPGDRVLTARAEYASNAIALLHLRDRRGIEIVLVDDDEHGQVSLDRLEEELQRGAAMVSLTHVPTNGGLVNPATAVGELCAGHDTLFVLDACQSAGQLPLDVAELRCDVLSATGRKYLRGPRGTGFLYVGPRAMERLEPPTLDLHSATWTAPESFEVRDDARRFESWESDIAAQLGLGAAVDYALDLGIDRTWPRVKALAARLRDDLDGLDGVAVHDKGRERCGIVTFTVDGHDATAVRDALRTCGVNTSVSPAEFAQFDLVRRGIPALVRASAHYYNDADELDRLARAVDALASDRPLPHGEGS